MIFQGSEVFLGAFFLKPSAASWPVTLRLPVSVVIGSRFAAILLELRPILFLLDSFFTTGAGRPGRTSHSSRAQRIGDQQAQSFEGQLTIAGSRTFIAGQDSDFAFAIDTRGEGTDQTLLLCLFKSTRLDRRPAEIDGGGGPIGVLPAGASPRLLRDLDLGPGDPAIAAPAESPGAIR